MAHASDSWPQVYWKCRDLGHAWTWDGLSDHDSNGYERRRLQCRDCPTWRHQAVSGGMVIKSRYHYPKDYILRGADVMSRQEVRAIVMKSIRASRKRLRAVR